MKLSNIECHVKGFFDVAKTESESLNELLGGGLRTDNFYVLQAPSGVGKTTFMMRMAIEALKQGKKVTYISIGEQDPREIKERIGCMTVGFDYARFIEGYDDKDCEKINYWYNKWEEQLLINYSEDDPFVYDAGSSHCPMNDFLKEALEEGCKYIFIDYLGSCLADTPEGQYAYLTKISGKLKTIATKKHLCIVTAMQTNRALKEELHNGNVDLESLDETFMADSIGPARKASCCMTIVKYDDQYHITVFKNRLNGKLGVVHMDIEPYTYAWKEYFNTKEGF